MSTLSKFIDFEEPTFDFEKELQNLIEKYETKTEVNFPIYIPSKGRAKYGQTAKLLDSVGLPYRIVIEPQDLESYKEYWPEDVLLVMPKNDQGIAYSRSFIKQHAHEQGEEYHWQIDDDMNSFKIRMNKKNVKVNPRSCFSIVEEICGKFSNIGLCGITHFAYAFAKKTQIALNRMTYGSYLIKSDLPMQWRHGVLDDLDFSLQVLEAGYCTIAFNTILFDTAATNTLEGGNQLNMFASGDARRLTYEKTVEYWPGRFRVKQLEGSRGWTLKHLRRFYNDYKQYPKLK